MPLVKTPDGTQILYNITGAVVAPLNNDNTFGVPRFVQYLQQLSWTYPSDTDEIKAYGQLVEYLSIVLNADGTLSRATMDLDALAILTGLAKNSDDPDYDQWRVKVGGAGLPYFGIIAEYANLAGEKALIGFPKMKLESAPGFNAEQNQFRVDETSWKALAPSTDARLLNEHRFYSQNSIALPDTGQGFDDFFNGFFDA